MAPNSDDTLLEARRMRLQELVNLQLCFLAKCAAEPFSHLEIRVALLLQAFVFERSTSWTPSGIALSGWASTYLSNLNNYKQFYWTEDMEEFSFGISKK